MKRITVFALAAGFAAGYAVCSGRHWIRDGRAMVLAFCDVLQQGARRG
jgi:hypothetical protein